MYHDTNTAVQEAVKQVTGAAVVADLLVGEHVGAILHVSGPDVVHCDVDGLGPGPKVQALGVLLLGVVTIGPTIHKADQVVGVEEGFRGKVFKAVCFHGR